jgi:hypothetical protein
MIDHPKNPVLIPGTHGSGYLGEYLSLTQRSFTTLSLGKKVSLKISRQQGPSRHIQDEDTRGTPSGKMTSTHYPGSKVAFVTGASGITGNAIIEHLIRKPASEW